MRVFNGLLMEAELSDQAENGARYRLTLRPWLHLLTRNRDYAIFQDKSAVDIIKSVFSTRNRPDVDFTNLSGNYEPREYCVQYRETDMNFISRLMEEEGIYYFFKHQDGIHKLTLCDGRNSHGGLPKLPFVSQGDGSAGYGDHVSQWIERAHTGAEGVVTLRAFDFKRPDQPREGAYDAGEKLGIEGAEVFDYPAGFLETDLGKQRASVMLESARRQRRVYHGQAVAPGLALGGIFSLGDHPIERLNQEYLITAQRYTVESQAFSSGGAASVAETSVVIEAIPADTPWRGPLVTPRPVARGPESAVVTGPAGEEVYTDEFGRVKVRFHWDRSGSDPEKSTCWMRVSHNSAGAGFGNIILPRIGQEVIVDFFDGDPDRPVVTGRVYNHSRMQTYALPDNKTRSVWRSQTIGKSGDYSGAEDPPGGEPGSNEIRLEDKGGSEEFYVHAQRNRVTWVRLDDQFKLGRDQTRRIGRDRKSAIHGNEQFTIETGDETHTVSQGKRTTTIEQNDAVTVQQGDASLDVKMGDYSVKTDLGSVTVEAMQQIELKVGGSSIVIDEMGITIKGAMTVKAEAGLELSAKGGLTTTVEGGVMTTVKGAIVMIN